MKKINIFFILTFFVMANSINLQASQADKVLPRKLSWTNEMPRVETQPSQAYAVTPVQAIMNSKHFIFEVKSRHNKASRAFRAKIKAAKKYRNNFFNTKENALLG